MKVMAFEVDASVLHRLSEFVSRRIGLHFPPERWTELQRGLRRAAEEMGFDDPAGFVQWLESSPVTRHQVEILASHLTVGETYFFRETACFEALEKHLLLQLIDDRRNGERRLRIWSAACCTGEEPYSVAILLRRLLPDLADWDVTLLATDINPNFLTKARAGIFGEWSFRHASPGIKERYFRAAGPGRYELLPEVREMVDFSYLNLSEESYPSLLNNTNAMDLILCRNVLIYLAPEESARWVVKLSRSLVERGWLAVGVVETMHISSSELAPQSYPGITMFQKRPVPVRLQPHVDPDMPLAGSTLRPLSVPKAIAPSTPRTSQPSADALARTARAHANDGRLTEALHACNEALSLARTDAVLHYLRSAILQEQNETAEAKASLKRAIYLDPGFVMAHVALGHLLRRVGQVPESERYLQTAIELLGAVEPSEEVPHSEGITAGTLKQLVMPNDSGRNPPE